MTRFRLIFPRLLAALALMGVVAPVQAQQQKPNVLFIAVDDLRPQLGAYGDTLVKSPHIDKLAANGTTFLRAYCQQAVCAPSRNSLLTGRRPDTIGIYDLATYFRTTLPDVVTLPQHFKNNGYVTVRMGKIFHTSHGNRDDKPSWTIQSDAPKPLDTPAPPPQPTPLPQPTLQQRRSNAASQPAYGAPDVADEQLQDGKIAGNAVGWLRQLKNENKPFFLAVGFLKPHLPFVAPKKYWDLYDPAQFKLATHRTLPAGAPAWASSGVGEVASYKDVPKERPLPDAYARTLIHGYHASVSFMDAQVGRVLSELDRLGLRDNTIIVLWGDHGWQLGEHGNWAKHNNYEKATNAPLIVSAAKNNHQKRGAKTRALAEFVDIFPSLVELAGLPKPSGLEGDSFVPLLATPGANGKKAAYSQWPWRQNNGGGGGGQPRQELGMGHAVRTDRYRFVEWSRPGETSVYELYDYQTDPLESVNIADRPANAALVAELKTLLHAKTPPRTKKAVATQ